MTKRAVPSDLISVTEVLELTGLSESGFRWLRKQKQAPRGHKKGKHVLFSRESVMRWDQDRAKAIA